MWLWLSALITFAVILTLSFMLLVFCRDASTHFNGINTELDKNILVAWFHRFYFILTTLTTIGYGDITPLSIRAKLFIVLTMFFVIGVIMKALSTLPTFFKETIHDSINNKNNQNPK